MIPITAEQIQILNNVKQAFIEKPNKFDMFNWCGTTHCIAGEIVFQNDRVLYDRTAFDEISITPSNRIGLNEFLIKAASLIGEDLFKECELFYRINWPYDLKTKHETGVEFLITSNEGAKNIQQIGKTIAQNTPVNAAPTIITGLGVSPDFKI